MQFDWDEKKAKSNEKKHGVSFDEAATVFGGKFTLTFADPDHSEDEDRSIAIGLSEILNILLVVFCERSEDTIRIISARKADAIERKEYEKALRFK